jgi:hypothetical protein
MKIRLTVLDLLRAYGRTDKAISLGAPQGCKRALGGPISSFKILHNSSFIITDIII